MAIFSWLALGFAWLAAVLVWVGNGRRWPVARLWWTAWLGALAAWVLGLATVPLHGASIWRGQTGPAAPWPEVLWRLDARTWPLMVTGLTAAWVALLVDAARNEQQRADAVGWGALVWAGGLTPLTALGASPSALMLGWALVDAAVVVADLGRMSRPRHRNAAIWAFFARSATWLWGLAAVAGGWWWLWWLVIMVRLVVAAMQPAFVREGRPPWRLVLGEQNLLATLAAATWGAGQGGYGAAWVLTLAALLALWGAWRWGGASSPLRAAAAGSVALGGLAVLAAAQGMPAAALTASLLALGVPFGAALAPHRGRLLWPFWGALALLLGLWPFTPGEAVLAVWHRPWAFWEGLAALTPAVGLWALARQGARLPSTGRETTRAGKVLCVLGLVVWVVLLWGWRLWPGARPTAAVSLAQGWLGVATVLGGAAGWAASRRLGVRPSRLQAVLTNALAQGVERVFWGGYRAAARFLAVFSFLLEGEGGVLWSLVLLAMLAVLLQR